MSSLLLDTSTWDLTVDLAGNIAVCTEPYAVAQDVACAARTFVGDCYYQPTLGIPYFSQILGKNFSAAFLKSQYVQAALSVTGVVSANFLIGGVVNRNLTGQIQFTDAYGAAQVVAVTRVSAPAQTAPSPVTGYVPYGMLGADGAQLLGADGAPLQYPH